MSHINKLQSLQSKILRPIVNAPWYVKNEDICRDLKIPAVKEEIGNTSKLAEASKTVIERRLKRKHPTDFIKEIK